MNSINLAICFAPSLLWPDSGLDVIKNEVPPLIQFMVEHSPEIFGAELPELYQVQGILSPSPRSYRVPTKKTDGNLRVYRHRRNGSFDTSTSEDSAGEDDVPSNLLHMQRSGLTVSDSQVSVLSQQLEDEEYGGGGGGGTAMSGNASFLGGHNHNHHHHNHHEGFNHHHLNPHSPKRQKKSRPPERSSSYRGPNERPAYLQKYHVVVDEATRRKSIATQTTLQQRSEPHYVGMSSSQLTKSLSQEASPFVKSRQMKSFDENEEYNEEEDDDLLVLGGRRPSQKRKRGGQPHRSAYSVDHIMQQQRGGEVDAHKVSYYDHLPPLSPEEELGQGRLPGAKLSLLSSRSGEGDSFETPMDEEEDEEEWHTSAGGGGGSAEGTPLHHPILSSIGGGGAHDSNQSIASRSSGSSGSHHYYSPSSNVKLLPQSRPSNLSLGSSVSESSYASTVTKESPEPETAPLNREVIKSEISRRFQIPSRDNSFTGSLYSGNGRSNSFNQEMDNIQRKFQERRRPEALSATLSTSSSTPHSGMESVSSPPSFDDRPESERHLHSLPRAATDSDFVSSPPPVPPQEVLSGYRRRSNATIERRGGRDSMTEHNPNKLLVDNYNSDTESSPSRTLTRRDGLSDVNTRTNARYQQQQSSLKRQQGSGIGRMTLGTAITGSTTTRHPPLNEVSIIPLNKDDDSSGAAVAKAALTQSPPPPQPEASKGAAATDNTTSAAVRPKSAQESGMGGEDIIIGEGMDFRKRTMSDVEKAKLKLGLIPPRRRSKSISETSRTGSACGERDGSDSGKEEVGEGVGEGEGGESEQSQDELEATETRAAEKMDKMSKRGIWRAHAPNSTDRKEAYTQRMKGATGGQNWTKLLQRGSVKASTPKVAPPPAIQRTATAPEMGGKRRATTMPEYLATRSVVPGRGQGRVLGRGLVRTVKITAYVVPEPRKIYRIKTTH